MILRYFCNDLNSHFGHISAEDAEILFFEALKDPFPLLDLREIIRELYKYKPPFEGPPVVSDFQRLGYALRAIRDCIVREFQQLVKKLIRVWRENAF